MRWMEVPSNLFGLDPGAASVRDAAGGEHHQCTPPASVAKATVKGGVVLRVVCSSATCRSAPTHTEGRREVDSWTSDSVRDAEDDGEQHQCTPPDAVAKATVKGGAVLMVGSPATRRSAPCSGQQTSPLHETIPLITS